jgi:hypothetical protein
MGYFQLKEIAKRKLGKEIIFRVKMKRMFSKYWIYRIKLLMKGKFENMKIFITTT